MKSDPALLVFGDQPTDKERLFRIVRERDFPALRRIDRDFVAIVHFPGEDVVVTSGAGVQPYFIGHGTASTVHGRTIAEVAAQISSGWEWDYHALGEYLSGALVTEGRTFHRGVRRLGRGRFVTIPTGCVAQEIRYAASPIDTSIAAGGTNAGELVEALLADLAEIARRHPCLYLSASGGFDSRVLLAAALRLSLPIRLLVSGGEGTTDRVIVEAISAGCRLDLRAVSLKRDDFLRNFVAISEATGGGLALDHWYGFLHLSHIGDPNAAVLMGVGGEVCRSHYFDRGIESLLLNCVPSSRRLDVFRQWLLRRGSVGPDHIEHLAPPLAAELRPEAVNALATHHAQLAAAGANDWLDGLDRFFVEQEIAYEQGLHFLGIEQIFAGRVVAPFTHGEFIRGARGLSRKMRLGSRFHRFAVQWLQPSLMNYPEYGTAKPMRPYPRPIYWLGHGKTSADAVSYVDTRQFATEEFDDLFKAHAHGLSTLISDELIARLSSRSSRLPTDARLFWTLLPLAVFLAQFRRSVSLPRTKW